MRGAMINHRNSSSHLPHPAREPYSVLSVSPVNNHMHWVLLLPPCQPRLSCWNEKNEQKKNPYWKEQTLISHSPVSSPRWFEKTHCKADLWRKRVLKRQQAANSLQWVKHGGWYVFRYSLSCNFHNNSIGEASKCPQRGKPDILRLGKKAKFTEQ